MTFPDIKVPWKRIISEWAVDCILGVFIGILIGKSMDTPLIQIGAFITSVGGLSAIGAFVLIVSRIIFNDYNKVGDDNQPK